MMKPIEKLINKLNVIGKIYPIKPDKINNKYNQFAPKKEIYPFNILNDDIYLPFAYSITDLSLKRKERKMFSEMIVKMEIKKIIFHNYYGLYYCNNNSNYFVEKE